MKRCENSDKLFPPNNAGWYRYLANSLESPDGFAESPLTIVTFNYDRSLEAYLHQVLIHRFKLTEERATSILRQMQIIHPHGILGEYPEVPYCSDSNGEALAMISRGIKVIFEIEDGADGFCSDEFRAASKALHNAERIYLLGFGFHDDNVRRLNFFSPTALDGKEIAVTVNGLGPRPRSSLATRLSKYGFSEATFCQEWLTANEFFNHRGTLD